MNSYAVLTRQIELTYRQFPMVTAVSILLSMLFASTVRHEADEMLVAAWFCCSLAIVALRYYFFREFVAARADIDQAPRWHFHLLLGAAASGLLWCAAAMFYFMVDDDADRVFVVLAVMGATMVGVVLHAGIRWVGLSYMLPALLPFSLVVLRDGDDNSSAVAVAGVLLLFVLIAVSLRIGRIVAEWGMESQRSRELAQGLQDAYAHLMAEMEQRQQADEHGAAFSRKFDLLMRQTPLATIEWGDGQRVTEWNPAAESLFGYSRAEVIGRDTVIDLIFAESSRNEAAEQWRHLVERREGFQIVTENVTREGGVLTCSWAVAPLLDADGKSIGVIAQARDITARNAAFRTLEESRRQLEEAQQLAHIGHWEWNFSTQQAGFSREALRIFGKPEGWFAVSEDISRLVTDGDGNSIMEQVSRACSDGVNEFSVDHCVGEGAGMRMVHTRVRVERAIDGCLLRFIAATQDVTELRSYQQQLHSLAFFDTLTGLPNRALLNDRICQSIADASWHKNLMGLMVLDLDRFKAINDTFGHGTGDLLLREAATRLADCVRAYDTVARLGGDEFAILLPEIRDGADLGGIAHKIVAAFAEPFRLESKELFVTCSIGIVLYPSDGADTTELLRCADSAMYHAKSRGRNNFQFYSTELTVRTAERLTLDAQLRQAERNGELELYYQPQIDLASGTLIGAEALLRWNHPERGLVMPDKFIGIAEDTGLIVGIGAWVLRTACCVARRWNEGGTNGVVKVAVNLSPRQFHMNDLVGTIRDVLEETGCRPEWLECEITESLLLDESDDIRTMLNDIHRLGISLSIDDFGTGYSSLGYLNRYPVESIKIDRSFVRDIMVTQDAAELVKAIISMAHSLHLELVAEGIETVEQEEFLKRHGCHTGQGWLYGKAMPQVQFEVLLGTDKTPQSDLFLPTTTADGIQIFCIDA